MAAVADAVVILLFASIGRDAHARGDIVTGAFATAWPFLAGAALSWLLLRVWKAPLAVWPSGIAVWIGAVVAGMLLRALTGQTVVVAFVIVATLSLGVLLLGYRAAAALVSRLARQQQRRP